MEELEETSGGMWYWTILNGVQGYKVTNITNGNSIFLPAAGCRSGGRCFDKGSYGYYWSSLLFDGNHYNACSLGFYSDNFYRSYNCCSFGLSLRPVCP